MDDLFTTYYRCLWNEQTCDDAVFLNTKCTLIKEPIHLQPRRIPLTKRNAVNNMLEEMHNKAVIEAFNSSRVFRVVIVKKVEDGNLHFFVHSRKLNENER